MDDGDAVIIVVNDQNLLRIKLIIDKYVNRDEEKHPQAMHCDNKLTKNTKTILDYQSNENDEEN